MAKRIEEPAGDCVVIDGAGDVWLRDGIGWSCTRRRVVNAPWSEIVRRGTGSVEVYERIEAAS